MQGVGQLLDEGSRIGRVRLHLLQVAARAEEFPARRQQDRPHLGVAVARPGRGGQLRAIVRLMPWAASGRFSVIRSTRPIRSTIRVSYCAMWASRKSASSWQLRRYGCLMVIMVELNEENLAQAAEELGTSTNEETVNAALALVAGRRARIEAMFDDPFALGTGPDISDEYVMRGSRL